MTHDGHHHEPSAPPPSMYPAPPPQHGHPPAGYPPAGYPAHPQHHPPHQEYPVATVGGGLAAPLVSRQHNPNWTTGLCSCERPCGTCLYGLFFPACAMASMRNEYDESNWCFNFLALSPCIARNLVRSGYMIEGDCCGDIFITGFCGPCVAAQMLHEVRTRGKITNIGRKAGDEWKISLFECDVMACLFGWCFPTCGVAKARDQFDGSNFCLNCMCMSPCLGRNIIREGYGIDGNCCGDIVLSLLLGPCVISQMIQETKARGRVGTTPGAMLMM